MGDAVDENALEEIRTVLFGSEREELTALRKRVVELEALVERVGELEALVSESRDRAESVGVVLPDAIGHPAVEDLGYALQSPTTQAIHLAARGEDNDLAIALYPVIGPAVRKMIANLLSFGPADGSTFLVRQVLLIERESGLLLASTSIDGETQDADIISGMLDAIRLFVQDAFEASEHDGLQDLRVGNTSVLVEWGPRMVLASVVQGVPDEAYRRRAGELLEALHRTHEDELSTRRGVSESLDDAIPLLHTLQTSTKRERQWVVPVVLLLVLVLVIFAVSILGT